MKNDMAKPLCYSCKFRQEIPGDAHSKCVHPSVKSRNDILKLMAMLGGRRGLPDVENAVKLNIKANPHGVANGWFAWPFNFDPVWLEHCDGYEEYVALHARRLP